MVTKLCLMRHGATTLNGCYVGATDIALSDSGVRQVQRTAALLRDENFTKIFCSPMLRCRQTVKLLELGGVVEYNTLLKEVDFGSWEKKSFNEIVATDKALVDAWAADSDDFSFPQGESLAGFRSRVQLFKEKLYECDEQSILVVTHGGIIRHLICELLCLVSEKYLVFQVLPGTFTSLQLHSEGGILTGFNISG